MMDITSKEPRRWYDTISAGYIIYWSAALVLVLIVPRIHRPFVTITGRESYGGGGDEGRV